MVRRKKVIEKLNDSHLAAAVKAYLQVKPTAFTAVTSEAQVKVAYNLLLALLLELDYGEASEITENLY
jgi:hypothetical protein